MNVFDTIKNTLKISNTEIISEFFQWGKVVQLCLDEGDYFIDFTDNTNTKKIVIQEGLHKTPNFTVNTTLENLKDLIDGSLDAMDAVIQSLVTIDGSVTDALEFSELLIKANKKLNEQ